MYERVLHLLLRPKTCSVVLWVFYRLRLFSRYSDLRRVSYMMMMIMILVSHTAHPVLLQDILGESHSSSGIVT